MFNPPIIKPKGYAVGGPVGIGVGNELLNPIVAPNSPESIQQDLDSLTRDLKKTQTKNKPVVKKEIKINERKEYEDIEDFRLWIKENTETDEESGQVFFIQPRTGERIPVDDSPEGNVLLYEVFKEQTGRTGEAADAIADLDIRQFQQSPESISQSSEPEIRSDDKKSIVFKERLEELRKNQPTVGNPEAMAAYASVPFDGSVVGTVAKGEAMREAARSQAILQNQESKEFYAYRMPGEDSFSLTPEPITLQEATDLGYELAPKEMGKTPLMP